MAQKVLHASGTFIANSSGATQVGGGDLDDDSDSSYIQSSAGGLGYSVLLDDLDGFDPTDYAGQPVTLHVRMSVTGGGTTPAVAAFGSHVLIPGRMDVFTVATTATDAAAAVGYYPRWHTHAGE